MTHEVRVATSEDAPAILGMLERAFIEDPFVRWVVRRDAKTGTARRRYFELLLHRLAMPHGVVWTTVDRRGAALWLPPGRWELSVGEQLQLLPDVLRIIGMRRYRMITRTLAALERRRPAPPWYFLALLGTEPEAQGLGIASALLTPVLDRCDREGVPALLDTSVEANVAWYGRRGFRVVGELQLGDGPTCWTMLRPAADALPP